MRLVVDANILFSALIKDGKTAEILANNPGSFYSPEFFFEEFLKHKPEILLKTKRTEREFNALFGLLKEIMDIVPKSRYLDMLAKAKEISPDPDDAAYFALALKLELPIWSNDKKLRRQSTVRIYSTAELM
ncbi:MAG: PIN domain-containing protein [Candidatus Micrarchaeia archaeon]